MGVGIVALAIVFMLLIIRGIMIDNKERENNLIADLTDRRKVEDPEPKKPEPALECPYIWASQDALPHVESPSHPHNAKD